MTALEECIKAAGIDLLRDTVQKFFQYSDTRVLFAEYFRNQVVAGMLKSGIVDKIIMASNVIDSESYHKIYLEETEKERQLSKVGIGEPFPETKMSVSKESIYLQKYARKLKVPDETLKYQRLPIFLGAAQQIGMQLDIDRTNMAVSTLINGDGNGNTPAKTLSGAADTVSVLIEFYTKLDQPYTINLMMIRKANLITYLTTLTGFSAPQAQFSFLPLATPEWVEWEESTLPANKVLGIDNRYAVEEICTGAMETENDRIIDGQLNLVTFVWRGAYAVFHNEAVCLWTVTS